MADPKQMKQNQYVVLGMAALLVFGALRAVYVTADEYDPQTIVWMNLGLDLGLTALCLVFLFILPRAEPGGLRALSLIAAAIGLAAGLIKLGARFSSDHGWWTGHYTYVF